MTKKQVQQDPGINSVQKMITLGMLVFMGYLFFMQDKQAQQLPQVAQEALQQSIALEPVKIKITDTDSGDISFSDLRKGKVLIGKWEVELDAPKEESSLSSKERVGERSKK